MKLEVTSKITYKSLMNKTKEELAYMVLDLLDDVKTMKDDMQTLQKDVRRLEDISYELGYIE